MKLETMESTSTGNSSPPDDEGLGSSPPVSEEEQESGGDSDDNPQQSPRCDAPKFYKPNLDLKRCKDARRTSKIPVLQNRRPASSQQQLAQSHQPRGTGGGGGGGVVSDKNSGTVNEFGRSTAAAAKEEKRERAKAAVNQAKVGDGDRMGIRVEASCVDFRDIFDDLVEVGGLTECGAGAEFGGMSSLSPRGPLAGEEMEVPILEAPEEFRCEDSKWKEVNVVEQVEPEERRPEPPYRDDDNAFRAETGDTNGRATDEDGRHHQSNATKSDRQQLWVQELAVPINTDSDNEHNIAAAIITTHVCDSVEVEDSSAGSAVLQEPRAAPAALIAVTSNGDLLSNGRVPEDLAVLLHSAGDSSAIVAGDSDRNVVKMGAAEVSGTQTLEVEGPDENCNDLVLGLHKTPGGRHTDSPCAGDADRDSPIRTRTSQTRRDVVGATSSPPPLQPDGCLRLDRPRSEPTATTGAPSIETDVAQCARASGCSRVSTAVEVCVALHPDRQNTNTSTPNHHVPDCAKAVADGVQPTPTYPQCGDEEASPRSHLSWTFKNGRLVFESENAPRTRSEQVVEDHPTESATKDDCPSLDSDDSAVLSSKDLNKRIDESKSRLKYLEEKLKKAGITDDGPVVKCDQTKCKNNNVSEAEQVVDKSPPEGESKEPDYDANQNVLTAVDVVDFCQFDVRQIQALTCLKDSFIEVYDELEDDEPIVRTAAMRGDGTNMSIGMDGERAKHNPDRDNLKSLLKRPGRNRDKRGNRVVFNENKNEFFDADYIILIREECDYDDEDDDGVCTCNQHEMVRLTCCEPNCNCGVYDGYDQTPQSPKFAPPLEFVDAVTLSPPEGYKDMELGEQQLLALQQMARRGQQRTAVCRECSVTHEGDGDDDGDGSQSDNEACGDNTSDHDDKEEKEKTDQSQQTTPTTPPNDSDSPNSQRYILETITMTTVTEQRILREMEEERAKSTATAPAAGGSPINGILKGGRLWKQQSLDANAARPPEPQLVTDSSTASDEEGSRRSVRFIETDEDKRDSCDGASDNASQDSEEKEKTADPVEGSCNTSASPESTEMMLTFKLGNHVLISNNSLKPNSAVRQLFPCTKPLSGKEEEIHQYLVTAESLRAFEEAKRSKLPQIIQSGETDESIKRAIERNTLRRSLIRYEPRSKKNVQKTDNSLVERIKQLTCDVDDVCETDDIPPRASPPGEEARNSPEINATPAKTNSDKSFSPSSSSTTSSNSSSMSSTYKKITDLFGKRTDKVPDLQNNVGDSKSSTLPDLGNGGSHAQEVAEANHCPVTKMNSTTNESRKQFLSTLAPLTACVSGLGHADEYYYHMNNHVGERASVASSVGTEYSLEDIDEGLRNGDDDSKKIAPDVLAGTPSASESGDELAMFVQQDASRIERIKKKYQPEQHPNKDEDDEHDDYGFNRRPSVRGIKPRFGSTTEILQQIQNQIQQPPPTAARVAWPYYSESGLTGVDNSKPRNMNQPMPNYQYPSNVPDEMKTRTLPPQYRPTSLQDENMYQNCSNQRCVREMYRTNVNQTYSSSVMKVGTCNEYYQSLPRRNGRPQSPPPLELSKNYHQTMVYIPYNHIEGYQPAPYYHASDYVRVSNQNQINKRYIEPVYQQRIHPGAQHLEEHHYAPTMMPSPMPKPMIRAPYSQPHLLTSRSESPLPGHFSTARSTQTPAPTVSTCNYYPSNPRYRPMVGPVWQGEGNYVTKVARHSFPAGGPRYPIASAADNISLTDSDSQHSGQMPNGYRQPDLTGLYSQKESMPNSPTKPRFIERGVPEGAASVPQQDSSASTQSSSSTMTSPTSPQNPNHVVSNQKPLFYAMNV